MVIIEFTPTTNDVPAAIFRLVAGFITEIVAGGDEMTEGVVIELSTWVEPVDTDEEGVGFVGFKSGLTDCVEDC